VFGGLVERTRRPVGILPVCDRVESVAVESKVVVVVVVVVEDVVEDVVEYDSSRGIVAIGLRVG
jgi:IS4 transposase